MLRADALPVDIRHASKVDRAAVGGWAERVLAGGRAGEAGREGPGHRGERACSGGARRRRAAARGDDVTVLQRRPAGLRHSRGARRRRRRRAVRAARRGHDAVVHLAAKVDVPGRWPRVRPGQHRRAPATSWTPAARAGVGRLVHVSSPVRGARRAARWSARGAGPADPARARGHYSRSQGGGGAGWRWPPTRARRSRVVVVRPHLVWGPGDTQLVGRIVARARAGRLPVRRLGRGADRHHLRRQRRRRARRRARPLRAGARGRPSSSPTASRARSPSSSPASAAAAGVRTPAPRGAAPGGPAAGAVVEARWALRGAARPADDPVPRRAAQHRPLVRPTPHARAAALDPARQHRRRASPHSRRPRPTGVWLTDVLRADKCALVGHSGCCEAACPDLSISEETARDVNVCPRPITDHNRRQPDDRGPTEGAERGGEAVRVRPARSPCSRRCRWPGAGG